MKSTLKKSFISLIVCLVMLGVTACGNSNRSQENSVTTVEVATETASAESITDTSKTNQADINITQYKKDFISGKWDGSPDFQGNNVISISDTGEIWLNNASISEPLYCDAAENESYYILDQDDTYVYYYKDVESTYFIVQVNKKTGENFSVEVPDKAYSAKLVLENIFVKGKYSLYRVDFTVDNPEAILIEECISDYEVVDYYSSIELHYITGDRRMCGIHFEKETGDENVIEAYETDKAHFSTDQGSLTFDDNELYSKAREIYAHGGWDGQFTDLHTLDASIPENTFATKDYDGNIIINNKIAGKYYRAMQVHYGCNVFESYYGSKVIYFEEGFNEYLSFYFPGQEEEYRVHCYGTTLPIDFRGYTRMMGFFYNSDLTEKTAGARVYLLTNGELCFLDCNFITEQVKTHVMKCNDHDIIDFNWAYDSLYYLLDNGEAYTIHYGEDDWNFKNPERFGGDRLFYALSHHTDEGEGALSLKEGNYGDTHLYSPYGENR